MAIKNKKIISVILLLILIGAGYGATLWLKNKKTEESQQPQANSEQADAKAGEKIVINYSRVTFFHALPLKCSLAMPDYWEGKYRNKEVSGEEIFYYIADPGRELEIFSIKEFSRENWEENNNGYEKIKEQDGFTFGLKLFPENIVKAAKPDNFRLMQEETGDIALSLKCFRLD